MGELNGERDGQKVTCPSCGGERLEKYGKTKAGLQKYRCLDDKCRRQFVAGSVHRVKEETKKTVIGLLKQGVAPTVIFKSVSGISLRHIRELRRKLTTL
jgi:transposase-like protein